MQRSPSVTEVRRSSVRESKARSVADARSVAASSLQWPADLMGDDLATAPYFSGYFDDEVVAPGGVAHRESPPRLHPFVLSLSRGRDSRGDLVSSRALSRERERERERESFALASLSFSQGGGLAWWFRPL